LPSPSAQVNPPCIDRAFALIAKPHEKAVLFHGTICHQSFVLQLEIIGIGMECFRSRLSIDSRELPLLKLAEEFLFMTEVISRKMTAVSGQLTLSCVLKQFGHNNQRSVFHRTVHKRPLAARNSAMGNEALVAGLETALFSHQYQQRTS
jgi:hypothetical protein